MILKPDGGPDIRTEAVLSCAPAKGDIVKVRDPVGGVEYQIRVQRVVSRGDGEVAVTLSKWF